LLGVLAQRRVRKLCVHCRRRDDAGRWHPVGCERCLQTGYKGRTGVYELMTLDDKLRSLIHGRASEADLFTAATAQGMLPMRDDGQRLLAEGITSLEEVLRVTPD
jgi:general secretion pathway protein E